MTPSSTARLLCFLAAATLVHSFALAGPKEEARAGELFDKAESEYQAGRFQGAVDLLLEAQRLAPDAVLHYNLARAYEGMGDLDRALDSYRAYVEAEPTSKDRGAVEARIKTLEALRATRTTRPNEIAPPPVAPTKPEPSSPSAAPWIIAGVGALGLGAGGILGGVSLSKASDAEDPATSGVDAPGLHEEATTFATAANGVFIGAGILLAAGVVWGIVDLTSSGEESVAIDLEIGPNRASLSGRF